MQECKENRRYTLPYALFGKKSDPNIAALVRHFEIFIDQDSHMHWDLETDQFFVNGKEMFFTKYFGRADVFEENNFQKYSNYHLMQNYLLSHPHILRHNPRYSRETPIKAANLVTAKRVGLRVPRTVIGTKSALEDCIVKPLTGGAHAVAGNEAQYTAIVQERMYGMNRRLFLVGDQHFGFELKTNKLDYRDDPNTTVSPWDFDPDLIEKTREVAKRVGLTYCAADFMDDVFLEVNSGPMFAAFDAKVNGRLAKAIRDTI